MPQLLEILEKLRVAANAAPFVRRYDAIAGGSANQGGMYNARAIAKLRVNPLRQRLHHGTPEILLDAVDAYLPFRYPAQHNTILPGQRIRKGLNFGPLKRTVKVKGVNILIEHDVSMYVRFDTVVQVSTHFLWNAVFRCEHTHGILKRALLHIEQVPLFYHIDQQRGQDPIKGLCCAKYFRVGGAIPICKGALLTIASQFPTNLKQNSL